MAAGRGLARTFSALRYRDFRLLWIGALTSTTGTWMQTVAQSWIVFSLTGSAFLLGVDGFLATFPMLLFSLFGGVLADRVSRKRIMMLSQLLQMTFAFVLAALVWSGRVEVWHIFVLSFLTGTAQSFSGPAYISLLPLLVRKEDVPNAIAMNSMQFNLARVIGPVLAGLALASYGAAICFGLNGLSFIAVIVMLMMIHPPTVAREGDKSVIQDLLDGFRFIGSRPALQQLSLLGFLGTFLGMPLITLLPVVAKSVFGTGPKTYSVLLAAYGIGSVAGAIVLASVSHVANKGRFALFMQLAFSVFLLLFALSTRLPLSLVLIFCAGASIVGVIGLFSSMVQMAATDAMRGRAMSIFMLAFRGGMPLGSLIAGYMAQRFSVSTALAINAVLLGLIALSFLLGRAAVTRIPATA